eukprot:Partr_v1_DN26158_c1_g1_i2_m10528 putative rho GTPase activating protein
MISSPTIEVTSVDTESSQQSSNSAMGGYDSLSIAALLDLFPQPPAVLPQKSTANPATKPMTLDRSKTKVDRKMGSGFGLTAKLKTGLSGIGESLLKSPSSPQLPQTPISASPSIGSDHASLRDLSINSSAEPKDERLQISLPPGVPDRDYVDLLKRACKGVIAPKERDALYKFLVSLPPTAMANYQRAVQDQLYEIKSSPVKGRSSIISLSETLGKSNMVLVELSKYTLDFGMKNKRVKIGEIVNDAFMIDCKAGKTKYTIHAPELTTGYELSVEPLTNKLKAKDKEEIKVVVCVKRPVTVSEIIAIEFENSHHHFIALQLSAEWSNFGSALNAHQMVIDEILPGHPHEIPQPLKVLKDLLLSKNGLEKEEIFRKQVDEEQMMIARSQFDQSLHFDALSAELISNLIKVWFRELPERLLNFPVTDVTACDSAEKAVLLFNDKVNGARRDLAYWLLDLLVLVLRSKEKNRMTSKKLGIVFAPNLFLVNAGSTDAVYLKRQAETCTSLIEDRIKNTENS